MILNSQAIKHIEDELLKSRTIVLEYDKKRKTAKVLSQKVMNVQKIKTEDEK